MIKLLQRSQRLETENTQVAVEASTDRRLYAIDEEIVMSLQIANRGGIPATLSFESAQRYDLIVFRGEHMVWRWSGNKLFASRPTAITLRGGEARKFTERVRAKALGKGEFDLIGFLTCTPPLHAECTFAIA